MRIRRSQGWRRALPAAGLLAVGAYLCWSLPPVLVATRRRIRDAGRASRDDAQAALARLRGPEYAAAIQRIREALPDRSEYLLIRNDSYTMVRFDLAPRRRGLRRRAGGHRVERDAREPLHPSEVDGDSEPRPARPASRRDAPPRREGSSPLSGAPFTAGIGGVLLFLAAGLGLVELLPALRARPLAARLGWAYLLGAAAVPGVVFLLGIAFDVRLGRGVVLLPAVLLAFAGLAARALRRHRTPHETFRPPPAGRLAARVTFGIAAVVAAGLFAEAVTHRETGWDAEMTWCAAARWVRADRSVTPRALTDARAYVDHPQYPLLLPVAQVVVQETFDAGDDPRAIKPLYAAFFPALLLVFFDLARRHAGAAAAALSALALALAPILAFERSGGAAGAYSDVPLGAFWGAGLVLLLGRARASEGVAAALLLAAGVLTKNEGLPFAAVALAAGGLAALLDRRAARARRLRALALAAGAVLAAAVALHAWKSRVPGRWDEDYVSRLRVVSLAKEAAARLPLLPAVVAAETTSEKDWSGLWLAAGAAVLAGASGLRRRVVPPALVALGGCLALYVGALLLSPWAGVEQVHPTWNRLLLQLSDPSRPSRGARAARRPEGAFRRARVGAPRRYHPGDAVRASRAAARLPARGARRSSRSSPSRSP